jgi:cytochrome c biogenesis protein CcmG/thiol:disulfide interchange protein DsbE
MKRPVTILAILAVAAVAVVGFLQTGSSGERGPALTGEAFARAMRQQLAGAPPPLAALHAQSNALLDGSGLRARLRALRGHPIVVNVWGSWCTPCRAEFPVFQRASLQLGREVAFVGIDTQDAKDAAARFLASVPVPYPSYLDFDGRAAKSLGLIGTPSTIFYTAAGRKAYLHQGPYSSAAALASDVRRYTRA